MVNRGVLWNSEFDEYREFLQTLPETVTGEAQHLIEGSMNGLVVDLRRAYQAGSPQARGAHHVTGELASKVGIYHVHAGKYVAGGVVKNIAKHAHLFENGTQARHNKIGANRGAMPPGHVFVPAAIRARRRLLEELKAMVLRNGASSVTGG